MPGTLYITGDEAADTLLNTDGNALLIGMLLDQQVPMEWAFAGPRTLEQRLGHLDPARIAVWSVPPRRQNKVDPQIEQKPRSAVGVAWCQVILSAPSISMSLVLAPVVA